MKFHFDIEISQSDYLDYNYFVSLKMPAGKKQMRTMRVFLWIAIAVSLFRIVQSIILSWSVPILPLAFLLLMSVWQILLPAYNKFFVRLNVNRFAKSGKLPYSPHAVMEFYDDHFSEKDGVSSGEAEYAAIERISVVEGKAVYLQRDSLAAYIIPMSAFESDEQYRAFIDFMSTKVTDIKYY